MFAKVVIVSTIFIIHDGDAPSQSRPRSSCHNTNVGRVLRRAMGIFPDDRKSLITWYLHN